MAALFCQRARFTSMAVTGVPRRCLRLEAARPLGASFAAYSATGQPRGLLNALIAVEFYGGLARLSQCGTVASQTDLVDSWAAS
jgi:hypothetical protein